MAVCREVGVEKATPFCASISIPALAPESVPLAAQCRPIGPGRGATGAGRAVPPVPLALWCKSFHAPPGAQKLRRRPGLFARRQGGPWAGPAVPWAGPVGPQPGPVIPMAPGQQDGHGARARGPAQNGCGFRFGSGRRASSAARLRWAEFADVELGPRTAPKPAPRASSRVDDAPPRTRACEAGLTGAWPRREVR